MVMFEQVLADMRERAAVARDAAKNDPDGTVHHEAVAAMLEYLAARAEVAHQREIAELNRKIADYERMLASSPIGLIYQLGICNQDGDVMNGIGLLFANEAERAKMPLVGYGDRFYIVPLEQAKIVKGGAE